MVFAAKCTRSHSKPFLIREKDQCFLITIKSVPETLTKNAYEVVAVARSNNYSTLITNEVADRLTAHLNNLPDLWEAVSDAPLRRREWLLSNKSR